VNRPERPRHRPSWAAYVTWGVDNSEVTLVRASAHGTHVIECVGCSLAYAYRDTYVIAGRELAHGAWLRSNDEPNVFHSYGEVEEHLARHRANGEHIPDFVDGMLDNEIQNPVEAWLPRLGKAPPNASTGSYLSN
jgi:hypothetical protein